VNDWTPGAILPNLSGDRAIEAEIVALAPFDDPRVQGMRDAIPLFTELLSRFSDAFGVLLKPFAFIARDDAIAELSADALLSFRDLAAISVIPYSRRSTQSTKQPTALCTRIPSGSILGR
jgi:hypothetical protein